MKQSSCCWGFYRTAAGALSIKFLNTFTVMGMFAFFTFKTFTPFHSREVFYTISIASELRVKFKQTKVGVFIAYHFLSNYPLKIRIFWYYTKG